MSQRIGGVPRLYVWVGLVTGVGVVCVLDGAVRIERFADVFNGWMLVFAGGVAFVVAVIDWVRYEPAEYDPNDRQFVVAGLIGVLVLWELLSIVVG